MILGLWATQSPSQPIDLAPLVRMRQLLPGATQLVYDNYNALAIGFGPSEKAMEAPFSIALYPRWVSLFFLQGARLPDPAGILKGSGKHVRSVKLTQASDLDTPEMQKLIAAALEHVGWQPDSSAKGSLVIRSVSGALRMRSASASTERSSGASRTFSSASV